MSEVPEARGPRLPDAIARVPGPVWPFLVLTVLAVYGRWQDLSGLQFGSPINDVALIAGSVPPIVSPLLGVALFSRHPAAHRTMPSVAFGVVLFAVLTVVDRLRAPILQSIANLDPSFESTAPAFLGYGLVQALVSVFALTYLSIGLADARRFEDSPGRRTVLFLLVVAAVGAPVVSVLLGFAWLSVQPLSSLVSVVSVVATNLAWAYLGWNAYRGWTAGEEPGTGWALVAGASVRLCAHRCPCDRVERVRLVERREQQPATAHLRGLPAARHRAGGGLAGAPGGVCRRAAGRSRRGSERRGARGCSGGRRTVLGALRPGRAAGQTRGCAGS